MVSRHELLCICEEVGLRCAKSTVLCRLVQVIELPPKSICSCKPANSYKQFTRITDTNVVETDIDTMCLVSKLSMRPEM